MAPMYSTPTCGLPTSQREATTEHTLRSCEAGMPQHAVLVTVCCLVACLVARLLTPGWAVGTLQRRSTVSTIMPHTTLACPCLCTLLLR